MINNVNVTWVQYVYLCCVAAWMKKRVLSCSHLHDDAYEQGALMEHGRRAHHHECLHSFRASPRYNTLMIFKLDYFHYEYISHLRCYPKEQTATHVAEQKSIFCTEQQQR